MKLPITDQFLWDMCKFLDNTEDAFRFIFHPARNWSEVSISSDDPIYRKYRKVLKSEQLKKLIYYLKKNNFIRAENLNGKKAIVMDKKGFEKITKIYFKTIDQSKTKRKDGKWIMIIFDVPEKWRKSRDLLRSILRNLGYKMFQQSVWVTPYDVSEKTEHLLQMYNLDEFVKIFLIEKI